MLIEKASPTVFTQLDDGTGVLLNLDTLVYYSLNRTGVTLWRQIEEGVSPLLDDLVRTTCDQFDVDVSTAKLEIGGFIERLQQFKIVRVQRN